MHSCADNGGGLILKLDICLPDCTNKCLLEWSDGSETIRLFGLKSEYNLSPILAERLASALFMAAKGARHMWIMEEDDGA